MDPKEIPVVEELQCEGERACVCVYESVTPTDRPSKVERVISKVYKRCDTVTVLNILLDRKSPKRGTRRVLNGEED